MIIHARLPGGTADTSASVRPVLNGAGRGEIGTLLPANRLNAGERLNTTTAIPSIRA